MMPTRGQKWHERDVVSDGSDRSVEVLLNRSICAHSLEKFDESFNDADMAKSILEGALEHEERNGTERSIRNELRFRLRKAYFRARKRRRRRKILMVRAKCICTL